MSDRITVYSSSACTDNVSSAPELHEALHGHCHRKHSYASGSRLFLAVDQLERVAARWRHSILFALACGWRWTHWEGVLRV